MSRKTDRQPPAKSKKTTPMSILEIKNKKKELEEEYLRRAGTIVKDREGNIDFGKSSELSFRNSFSKILDKDQQKEKGSLREGTRKFNNSKNVKGETKKQKDLRRIARQTQKARDIIDARKNKKKK